MSELSIPKCMTRGCLKSLLICQRLGVSREWKCVCICVFEYKKSWLLRIICSKRYETELCDIFFTIIRYMSPRDTKLQE